MLVCYHNWVMPGIVQRLTASSFLRHNAVFFVGAVLVGALNYLYYPVLGRLMDPVPFGEVQTLVSLFLQLTIFLTVLGLVTVNITANYTDTAKRNATIFELERLAFGIGLIFLLGAVVFARQLQHFLRFNEALPFVILMLTVVATVPFIFRTSFIRGAKRFGVVSSANILAAAAKIVFSVVLVLVGLGTAGAIGGVLAAQLTALLFASFWAKRLGLLSAATGRWRLPDLRVLRPELSYAGLVLVGSLVVTTQFSIDIVAVKHYFDAHTAGLYAGVASVARIIFFATASVAQVLMPTVTLAQQPAQNRKLLIKSVALLSACGLPVLAVFVVAPAWIIQLLMGPQYVGLAHLLPLLSVTIFLISIINLLVAYYMALRRYGVIWVVIGGAIVTYGLMFIQHTTPNDVIISLLCGSITMLGLASLWEIWRHKKTIAHYLGIRP